MGNDIVSIRHLFPHHFPTQQFHIFQGEYAFHETSGWTSTTHLIRRNLNEISRTGTFHIRIYDRCSLTNTPGEQPKSSICITRSQKEWILFAPYILTTFAIREIIPRNIRNFTGDFAIIINLMSAYNKVCPTLGCEMSSWI